MCALVNMRVVLKKTQPSCVSSLLPSAQDELYAKLEEYAARAVPAVGDSSEASKICFVKWKDNNNYVMPWAEPEDPSALGGRVDTPHPDNCGMYSSAPKTKVPGFMNALPRGKGNY